jgi:hypothetical protein
VYLLTAALLMVACNRAPENKEAVRLGVMEHLQKAGTLDLNGVDVTVTDVKYEGNQATAQVAFKPKADPEKGMSMSYKLERRGNKWLVMGKGAGHMGGAMGGPMGGEPPKGQMPSGHPPVDPGATKGGDLPAGHPPVNQPPPPAK